MPQFYLKINSDKNSMRCSLGEKNYTVNYITLFIDLGSFGITDKGSLYILYLFNWQWDFTVQFG